MQISFSQLYYSISYININTNQYVFNYLPNGTHWITEPAAAGSGDRTRPGAGAGPVFGAEAAVVATIYIYANIFEKFEINQKIKCYVNN